MLPMHQVLSLHKNLQVYSFNTSWYFLALWICFRLSFNNHYSMKRTIEFMYCAEESLLATLCWGFWQGSYKFRNHMINVKCFLDDSRGGVHWTCEPSTKAVILLGTELVKINGTFRHNDCKRVSLEGVPFSNLQCSSCASIPKERDFCMRVYRDM